MGIIGDIKGKTCIINDDMIDTAGTLCANVKELKAMALATSTSAPPTVSSPVRPSSA